MCRTIDQAWNSPRSNRGDTATATDRVSCRTLGSAAFRCLRIAAGALRISAAIGVIAASLVLLPRAVAQDSKADKEKDVIIDRAEFGFLGTVPPEAWTPITVWITGGQRGFSGVMVVQFDQDDTQPARIVVPAAATPGVSVPIEAVACLPGALDSVSISMVDQNGREKASATFSRYPKRHERQLIADTVDDQWLILCVGRASAVRGFPNPRYIAYSNPDDGGGYVYNSAQSKRPPADLVVAAIDSGRLPLSWAAYSGAEAVVMDCGLATDPDPRAIEALRTWVLGGGRLILVANGPGGLWRRWLPSGVAGDLVELGEVARHDVGIGLDDAVRAAGAIGRPGGGVFAVDAARRDTSLEPSSSEFLAAKSVNGRLVRPTARGKAEGWTTRWSPPGLTDAGLLAEGPVGLGWVTILGVDPELAAAAPSKETTAAVWGDAVRVALAGWLERTAPDPKPSEQEYYLGWDWQYSRSAPDRDSRAALSATLEHLGTVAPIGRQVFWAIALCLAALAVLVGPLDALVLKRLRMRHLSWLTALAWIGLASAGAYFVPTVIRSGKTTLNRVSVIDIVRAGEPGSGTAWQTGVTGVFASRRGEMLIRDANPASWWRGISARPWNRWDRRHVASFPALTTVQSGSEGSRASVPESIWQGQWTFRTFQDDGPLATRLAARVRRADDGYEVRLDGLPEGASVASAALRVGGGWFTLGTGSGEPRPGRAPVVLVTRGSADPKAWDHPDRTPGKLVTYSGRVMPVFGLPGPRQRTSAIDASLRSGSVAAVYLLMSGGPPAPHIDTPADYGQQTIVRILVPLSGAEGGAPEAGDGGTQP